MNALRGIDGAGGSLFNIFPLGEDDRELFRKLVLTRKAYSAHTDIAKEGDTDDRLFFVRSGWTALYRIVSTGERRIIDFPVSGEMVGLNGTKSNLQLSFMAVTDAVVLETSTSAFIATVARSESLTRFIFGEAARQRAILIEHLTNLARRSALSRIAHLLLEIEARLRNAGLAGSNGYECALTQYDLADALGLTAIHVNRMLGELRRSDLLHFHKGFVSILDRDGLTTLCDFDPAPFAR